VLSTGRLPDHPSTYSPSALAVSSLWEFSTSVPEMRFGSAGRVEDDHAKESAGTRLVWLARAASALGVRGTRLVDTSDAADGSSGFTDAGSSLIDIGISLPTLNLSAVLADLNNTVVL
jgi:hypothetical protein